MGVKGWQVVFTGEKIQADLVAAVLEAHGVRAEVLGDWVFGLGVGRADSRVMVPDDQAAAARELVRQAAQAITAEVPDDADPPGDQDTPGGRSRPRRRV